MPGLLLEPRVAVVPVRAVLPQGEAVRKRLARADTGEVHAGDAVHRIRYNHAMPVDRGVLAQGVRHPDDRLLPFAEPEQRPWDGAIDRRRHCPPGAEADRGLGDPQVDSRLPCPDVRGLWRR